MNKIRTLIFAALAEDIDLEKFRVCAPQQLWENDADKAALEALLSCKDLDWERYISENADAGATETEPVAHFIKFGLIQNRKIHAKQGSALEKREVNPKITVVVPNFNNSLYLRHSIGSLLGQTLKEIEVIAVDDHSKDDSLAILEELQKGDARLKIVWFPENRSQHMARKAGVEAARGEFIMFLDSDDFYSANALELCYKLMQTGCDIGAYNADLVLPPHSDPKEAQAMLRWINNGEPGLYRRPKIMEKAFRERTLSSCIHTKIYKTDLVRKAFAEMETGMYPRGQDEFEAFAFMSLADTIHKIEDRLYHYRIGVGVSTPAATRFKSSQFQRTGDVIRSLTAYAEAHDLASFLPDIVPAYMRKSVEMWLDYLPGEECTAYFDNMVKQYGMAPLLTFLVNNHLLDWSRIAEVFRSYCPALDTERPIRRIGMVFSTLGDGGAEKLLLQQTRLLAEAGYEITLFLGQAGRNDAKATEHARIIYLPQGKYERKEVIAHLTRFADLLRLYPQDLVLFHESWSSLLLWQLIICRYLRIPVIVFQHSAFYRRILYPELAYGQRQLNSVLKCADKVLCLSRLAELYYRQLGINASEIHNPIKRCEYRHLDFRDSHHNIVVVGRLGEPLKQINDCLDILAHIVREEPAARMTFLGSFNSDEQRSAFLELAQELNLQENIRLPGWVDDPAPFLDKAVALLSTSYSEGFPLSIAEALAVGTPVVAYRLGITLERENPALITVEQGDKIAAASALLKLMRDGDLWNSLYQAAYESVYAYTSEAFMERFRDLLASFRRSSEVSWYSDAEFQEVIRMLGFYGGDRTPWTRQGQKIR